MSLYRNVLKKAWEISWHYKYLWFFGLFATILWSGGEYDFIMYIINSSDGGFLLGLQQLSQSGVLSPAIFANAAQAIAGDPVSFIIIIVILMIILALLAFLVWLVIISQIAIISSSAKISTSATVNFKEAIDSGLEHFWKVFSLNLLQKIIISALVAITLWLMAVGGTKVNIAAQVLVFVFMLLLSVFIAFITKYAINYIVVKNKGFKESIVDAWQLFRENWLVTVEMTLLVAFISVGVALATIFFMLTVSSPFVFIALLALKYGSMLSFWLTVLTAAMVFLVLAFLIGAIFTVFQNASWTILFLELASAGAKSKIMRLLAKND